MVPGSPHPDADAASRSSTSTRGPAPASRCSTPTGRWRRSAGAALVGSGGPAGAAFASRPGDWSVCYELLSVSARDVRRHRLSLNTVLKWAAQRAASRRSGPDLKEFLLRVLPYCFRA